MERYICSKKHHESKVNGTNNDSTIAGCYDGDFAPPAPCGHGLIATHEDALDTFLSQRSETAALPAEQRRKLCETFLNHLVGIDTLRVLLGMKGLSEPEMLRRAKFATTELLSALVS